MNNTIPPEIKKWIEYEAYDDLRMHKYEDLDGVWVAGATSLYKHLQENGRVAELEKECERLKGILEKIIRTTRFYLPNLSSGEAWQQFKTENNL